MTRIYAKAELDKALALILEAGVLRRAEIYVEDATPTHIHQVISRAVPDVIRGPVTTRYTITIDIEDTPNAKAPEAD